MQSAITQDPAVARPGMDWNTAGAKSTRSMIATGDIYAGFGVIRVAGMADDEAKASNTDNSVTFLGVALLDPTAEAKASGADFVSGDMVPVRDLGGAVVQIADTQTVTPDSPVYLVVVGTEAGKFRGSADGTNTIALANCRFLTSSSEAGGWAALKVDTP